MSPYAQSTRDFRFDCGLGEDAVAVEAFTLEEGISRPYRLVVDLVSERAGISWKDVLEKKATLTIATHAGTRDIHGFVSRFTQLGQTRVPGAESEVTHYRLEVVPKLWFAGLASNTRIFQQKSVPDIVKAVLAGIDLDITADGSHPVREYCVQYQESNLQFVSRLLEEEGFFYYFDQADGGKLKIADTTRVFAPCPEIAEATMHSVLGEAYQVDGITAFTRERGTHTNTIALADYNFEQPSIQILVSEHPASGSGGAALERYEYPGGFLKRPRGEEIARVRIEELEAQVDVANGSGTVRSFVSGHTFKLADHFNAANNAEFVLLSVRHHGRAGSLARIGGNDEYWNEFVVVPKATKFRPARTTPRPRILGTQTAFVTGPNGEEIYTDQYGRVKVQFHWDREGKQDDKTSCWVRVASVWAGNGFGFQQVPRIGDEVIVDFLDGDPDHPIITGRVYNAHNMPPFALPDNGTQSGFKTHSSKNGSSANFNELRFEDKKGSEQVYLHAEKQLDVEVEADETHWVGHDQTNTIDHDRTEHVKNNETITIDKDRTETVQGAESITIAKSRTESVGENESVTIGKSRTLTIGENDSQTIGQSLTLAVGENYAETIGGAHTVSVGKDQSVSIAKKLVIEAGDEITFKCGASQIVLKKDGSIQLSGKDITVKGSGNLTLKASTKVDMEGTGGVTVKSSAQLALEGSAMAELKSSGIAQIQGSLVKIN